jgi:TetR/AcrR family transcriptional repressor of nem operon
LSKSDVKERLLAAGLSLFFRRGFNATGVKDIVDSAAVPKGSFYAYFPSKDALGVAALERYWTSAGRRRAMLSDTELTPKQRLRAHFRLLSEGVAAHNFENGCLIGNFAAELSSQSPGIRAQLAEVLAAWTDEIAACVAEAGAAGELAVDLDPRTIASFLLTAWEGAVLRAKTDQSRAPFDHFEAVVFEALFA